MPPSNKVNNPVFEATESITYTAPICITLRTLHIKWCLHLVQDNSSFSPLLETKAAFLSLLAS